MASMFHTACHAKQTSPSLRPPNVGLVLMPSFSSWCTSSAVFSLAAYCHSASVLTGKLLGIIASILLAIRNFHQPDSSPIIQTLLTWFSPPLHLTPGSAPLVTFRFFRHSTGLMSHCYLDAHPYCFIEPAALTTYCADILAVSAQLPPLPPSAVPYPTFGLDPHVTFSSCYGYIESSASP